jgi:hypothetical protein
MNNGGYMSQAADVVGPKVEELVRADLESQTPIPFEIEMGGAGKLTAGGVLSDAAKSFFGGRETLLFTVCFNLQQPRPITLQVPVDRQGVGSHLGALLYTTKLSKPVAGEASLGDPKMFGSSKFAGDAAVADKLNANSELIKRVNKFSRLEWQNMHLKAPRMVKVSSVDGAGVFAALTLPRSHAMGMKVSLDVKEFVELAGLVEASL